MASWRKLGSHGVDGVSGLADYNPSDKRWQVVGVGCGVPHFGASGCPGAKCVGRGISLT